MASPAYETMKRQLRTDALKRSATSDVKSDALPPPPPKPDPEPIPYTGPKDITTTFEAPKPPVINISKPKPDPEPIHYTTIQPTATNVQETTLPTGALQTTAGQTVTPFKTSISDLRDKFLNPPKETTPPPAPSIPTTPTGETVFDLQRQRVEAGIQPEIDARQRALEARLAAQGIDDSGIALAQARQVENDVRTLAGVRMGEIDISELNTLEGRDRFYASLNQAADLANRGMDLQQTALSLQEKGMNQTDARYYAGLAQADRHAQQGFTLQESAQALQQQGLTQQDAQYYAGLSQAKLLADRGMDQQDIALELQRQGLNDTMARFTASLAHDKDAQDNALTYGLMAAIFQDTMDGLVPGTDIYNTTMNGLLEMLTGATGIQLPLVSNAVNAVPPVDNMTPEQVTNYVEQVQKSGKIKNKVPWLW